MKFNHNYVDSRLDELPSYAYFSLPWNRFYFFSLITASFEKNKLLERHAWEHGFPGGFFEFLVGLRSVALHAEGIITIIIVSGRDSS